MQGFIQEWQRLAMGAAMSITLEVCMGKKCESLELQALLKIENLDLAKLENFKLSKSSKLLQVQW
jgi:hypothetical protein